MQLAIVQNPHTDKPQELWDKLQEDDFDDVPEGDMSQLRALFGSTPSLKAAPAKKVQ